MSSPFFMLLLSARRMGSHRLSYGNLSPFPGEWMVLWKVIIVAGTIF